MWKYVEKFFHTTAQKITPRQKVGLWGEREAENHLKGKGYKILGKRFRIGRRDEIDLIARDNETLVFIEVKTRAAENFGRPFAAVDRNKQHRLARAAIRYLKRLKSQPENFRFDVIEIVGSPNSPHPAVRHIENAFPLPQYFRIL